MASSEGTDRQRPMETADVSRLDDASRPIDTFVSRFLPLRRLGWAFLLAWVFCVFYTDAASGYVGGTDVSGADIPIMATLFYASLPLAMSILMLVIIVLCEKRFGSPASHAKLLVAAPVITAVSTPLMFISFPSTAATAVMFASGAILTGIGSGMLWVMWGEYYCTLNRDEVEFLAPVSSIIALLLILTVANVTGWLSIVITTSFPLLCGLCLILSMRDAHARDQASSTSLPHAFSDYDHAAMRHAHQEAAKTPLDSLRHMGRTNLGILVCCLVVCVEGAFASPDAIDTGTFDLVLLFSGFLAAAIALRATSAARQITSSFLFRWMCPLLVLGLAFAVLAPDDSGATIAYTISIASRLAFCLFTQMYFALIAASGHVTPTQSYGLGWISVHLGDLLGVICIVIIENVGGNTALRSVTVCLVLIVVLVAVVMYVLGRSDQGLRATDAGISSSVASSPSGSAVDPYATSHPYATTHPYAAANPSARSMTDAFQADAPDPAADTSTPGDKPDADVFEQRLAAISSEHGLTPRETQILRLLAHGRSIPYIRDELFISKDTASTHVKHIYTKLDVHSRQELIDLFSEA